MLAKLRSYLSQLLDLEYGYKDELVLTKDNKEAINILKSALETEIKKWKEIEEREPTEEEDLKAQADEERAEVYREEHREKRREKHREKHREERKEEQAYCRKCGDEIKADESSICGNCI